MSVVNTELKYIFIHNPKVAGTSMEQIVGGSSHQTIHGYYTQGINLEDFYKWMFVRNPYTRLISAYNQAKAGPTIFINRHTQNKMSLDEFKNITINFTTFVANIHKLFDFNLQNYNEEMFHKNQHIIMDHIAPQSYFCNIDGKNVLDFIGRLESIDCDWFSLCRKIGIIQTLPQMNIGISSSVTNYYQSQSTIDIVNELYNTDFELFGYNKL